MARTRIPDADGLAAVRAVVAAAAPDPPGRPVDRREHRARPVDRPEHRAQPVDRPTEQSAHPDDHPGHPVDRTTQRLAVRYTLQALTDRAPGHSVEVRIPPFAAVQAIPGPVHRRGTPSAVVEIDPATWLALATGTTTWAQAKAAGRIRASGERADLDPWLPLVRI